MFKFMRKMSPNFTREKSFCIKRMAPGWFLLTVLYPALASAQVSELWVARYHGSVDGSNDAAVAMALDKAGNVYITGQSSGAGTGIDYATVAYDPKGNQLWVARYNGPANGDDSARGVAVDSKTGHVYVTGSSEAQFATVAYDLKGNQLWVARLTAEGYGASAIAIDSNIGNVYVTGAETTAAYDSNGNQLWVATDQQPDPHHHFVFFTAIAVDTKSRVYVTGSISIFGGYETHFRTVSYDQTGTHLWADQPIFGFRFGGANAIALGNAANVYIVGSIVDDASGRSLYVTLGYGDQPIFGATYPPVLAGHDVANAVAVDSNTGNVYVTGQSSGDYATVAYNAAAGGRPLWVARYYVAGASSGANAIAVDSATGNVYVAGTSQGNYAMVVYDSGGHELSVAQHSTFLPSRVAVDSNTGNVIVTGKSQGSSGGNDFTTIAYSRDTTPPVTTASASPGPNGNGWNKTNVTVTLNSVDDSGGSGVKQIQYELTGAQSVDMQTVPGSAASVTLSAEGMTTLNYFGTDKAGNAEQSKALTVQIDKTPPVVSGLPASGCTLWPPNNQMVQVATIAAADALSGLAPGSFQLTGSSNEPSDPNNPDVVITSNGSGGYVVQLRAARLGSGTGRIYTMNATAMDLAGNTVTSTATCTLPRDHSTAVAH